MKHAPRAPLRLPDPATDPATDPYHWLCDLQHPDTMAYIQAENQYVDQIMEEAPINPMTLYQEFLARIQETDQSAPWIHDHFLYYFRTLSGQEYPLFCRTPNTPGAAETLLLDYNILAEGKPFFAIGQLEINDTHRYLAYTLDTVGSEIFQLFILDLETQTTIVHPRQNLYSDFCWITENSIGYLTLDPAQRPDKAYLFNLLCMQQPNERLLYTETDERFTLSLQRSRSKHYLFLSSHSGTSSEIHYATIPPDNTHMDLHWTTVKKRAPHTQYTVAHAGDAFYVLMSTLECPNYALWRLALPNHLNHFNHPHSSDLQWTLVIPHDPAVYLDQIEGFKNDLILFCRENALIHIEVCNLKNKDTAHTTLLRRRAVLPEACHEISPGINMMYDTDDYRFHYESPRLPPSTYHLNMQTLALTLIKTEPVLGGYHLKDYSLERIWVPAPATASTPPVQIPISLIFHKDHDPKISKQPCPLLLYGYGAYGISIDPGFSDTRLSLLNRGIMFAIAHIRGGGELGKHWHEQGRLMHKHNTFDDFILCADALVQQGYTTHQQLLIQGRSAGGLLIGAVLNKRPDLCVGALLEVPFVDTLNTMQDPSLPLTIGEYEEWGNPDADQDTFDYIKSYSPYNNIQPRQYPHILVTNSLQDARVHFWEALKWVAQLKDTTTQIPLSRWLCLIKTDLEAGHFGKSGRYQSLKEIAFQYAFILLVLAS
jgi:oligopeptidase B